MHNLERRFVKDSRMNKVLMGLTLFKFQKSLQQKPYFASLHLDLMIPKEGDI